jgi:prepilin-type N-terminal cleavage/methylation domain-containing protein
MFRIHTCTRKSAWNDERGFSLVEMIVAVGLFAIIMMVAVGALLALVEANRKARSLESVMNNLNISLDSMVRSIRMGSRYNCGSVLKPIAPDWGDCAAGIPDGNSVLFSFAAFESNPELQTERWVYLFEDGRIYRSKTGSLNDMMAITAPEVVIEDMQFYAVGTTPGDAIQPKIVVVVKGTAGAEDVSIRSTFYIQATAVQRSLDINYD